MGWFIDTEDVPVELDCRCPGKPHETDTVWLYAETPLELGIAFEGVVSDGAPTVNSMTARLGSAMLVHGIRRWTFVDAEGKPVPCDMWTKSQFARNWDAAKSVAEKADALYAEALTAPLVKALSKSSQPGQTAASTSASKSSSVKSRKRSKRSTTATTPLPQPAMTTSE